MSGGIGGKLTDRAIKAFVAKAERGPQKKFHKKNLIIEHRVQHPIVHTNNEAL